MKCDELKPICRECSKGSRGCTYPPENEKRVSRKGLGGVNEAIENRLNNNDSKKVSDSDGLNADDTTQKVIVKFSARGSSATTSANEFVQPYQQILVDSPRAPGSITEFLYNPPSSIHQSYFFDAQSSTNVLSTRALQIPTIPKSIRDDFIQFFISFHQVNINEFHYFCYHDYHKFCTRTLIAMIEQPNPLRDAVVAFSAMIYSMKVDRSTRVLAFRYYTSAVQRLQVLLDQITLSVDECHIAIATALQLASFDVFAVPLKIC